MSEKIRVAWFSPLNTAENVSESVSAYASDLLLPILSRKFEIDLFHNDFSSYRDYPTFHYLSAFEHHRRKPYDIVFYQLEDRRLANFIRVHLGLMPGLVWFHDLIFTSFGPEPILNSPWRQIVEKFRGAHEWPERGAEFDQFGPLGFREGAWASQALFSNPVAHAEYQRSVHRRLVAMSGPGQSACLPMPIKPFTAAPVFNFKTPRILFCGSPRIEHRSHKLLQALACQSGASLVWLLDAAEAPQAGELLKEFGVKECRLVCGRTPQAWIELVSQAEIAVHTHFSVYGQADPYHAISMAAGLPTIASKFGATEYLPDNLVFKIEPGDSEALQISEVINALQNDLVDFDWYAVRRSAEHRNSSDLVASELASFFEASLPFQRKFRASWHDFELLARAALIEEAKDCLPASLLPSERHDCWERICEPGLRELGCL